MTGRLRAAHWPPSYPDRVHPYAGQPPQRPAEPPQRLPEDPGLAGLYAGALRHLAVRAGLLLGNVALRLAHWGTTETRETARNRAVAARHPSTRPHLAAVPDGIAQGRADLQFTHRPRGHGASEGDPDL